METFKVGDFIVGGSFAMPVRVAKVSLDRTGEPVALSIVRVNGEGVGYLNVDDARLATHEELEGLLGDLYRKETTVRQQILYVTEALK